MRLFDEVVQRLDDAAVPFALIGATAMGVHGVPRATLDTDLLVRDRRVLEPSFWNGTDAPEIRHGDAEDVFHGVVRFGEAHRERIDIVVPKYLWMDGVLARGKKTTLSKSEIRVATLSDLVLLKLFAGGFKDRNDIAMLVSLDDDGSALREVDTRIVQLDDEAQTLWLQIKASLHL